MQRNEEQTTIIRTLKREMEELREERVREQTRETRRVQEDADEIATLRRRVEQLEQERLDNPGKVRMSTQVC